MYMQISRLNVEGDALVSMGYGRWLLKWKILLEIRPPGYHGRVPEAVLRIAISFSRSMAPSDITGCHICLLNEMAQERGDPLFYEQRNSMGEINGRKTASKRE